MQPFLPRGGETIRISSWWLGSKILDFNHRNASDRGLLCEPQLKQNV